MANNTRSNLQPYVCIDCLLFVVDSDAHPESDSGNSAAHLTLMQRDSLQQQRSYCCNAFLAMNSPNTKGKERATPAWAKCLQNPPTDSAQKTLRIRCESWHQASSWTPIPHTTNEELTLLLHFGGIMHWQLPLIMKVVSSLWKSCFGRSTSSFQGGLSGDKRKY